MRRARGGLTAAIIAAGVLVAPGAVLADGTLCDRFGVSQPVGEVAPSALVEISGLASSRSHPGVLWAHNDSGDRARVFALDETGVDLGTYRVVGAGAIDWEDIAVGPGPDPDVSYLYVADIGDNAAIRTDGVTVYRAPEPERAPSGRGGRLTGVDALELEYPDGPRDAEALLVDPRSGDLVVITKDVLGASEVYVADAGSLAPGEPIEMVDAGDLLVDGDGTLDGLPDTMITAADISPDGSIVLVRTYQSVLAFERTKRQSVAEALGATPCRAPVTAEPQGEAIAFTSDGTAYLTASEILGAIESGQADPDVGAPLYRVPIAPDEAPTTTTTTAATTTTSTTPSTTIGTTRTTAATTATSAATTPTTDDVPTVGEVADEGGGLPTVVVVLVLAFAAVVVVGVIVSVRRGGPTDPAAASDESVTPT